MTDATHHDLAALECPRCEYAPDVRDPKNYMGCPKCRDDLGIPVNYVTVGARPTAEQFRVARDRDPSLGIWRWKPLLPVRTENPVTLGEGNTPLIHLADIGARSQAARLYLKNEAANPTWSHKDRLCAAAVAAGSALGATAVVAASTGNHGASLAAYAAGANMRCVISTVRSVPETMRILMEAYGAEVQVVERSEERFAIVAAGAAESGWYPCSNASSPPVGSTPYGVDAYKTIAFELWEQTHGEPIAAVVVPTGYGDCIRGIARGFDDLRRAGLIDYAPRLIAAEVFGSIGNALRSDGFDLGPTPTQTTAAFSIGGAYTTYQAIDTVRSTGGTAIAVSEDEILHTHLALARLEGIYAEASSATALAAAERAYRSGVLDRDDLVVVISTSSGLKDPLSTAQAMAERQPVPTHS